MRDSTRRLHASIRAEASSAATPDDDLRHSLRFVEVAESRQGGRPSLASEWLATVALVEHFADTHGRLPRNRRNDDIGEARLADWIAYQRVRFGRGELSTYERDRLQCLPGFSWAPRAEQWESRLEEYDAFVTAERRKPRYRSGNPEERRAADWAARQRARLQAGRLPADHLRAFTYVERRAERMGLRERTQRLQP